MLQPAAHWGSGVINAKRFKSEQSGELADLFMSPASYRNAMLETTSRAKAKLKLRQKRTVCRAVQNLEG